MFIRLALPLFAMLAIGCGDDAGPFGPGPGPGPGPNPVDCPDQSEVAQPEAGRPGAPCTTNAECDLSEEGGDGFCLTGIQGSTPVGGYCLGLILACTEDADCGERAVCASIEGVGNACYFGCDDEGLCPDGFECSRMQPGGADIGTLACLPGTCGVPDGAPCDGVEDCTATGSVCFDDPRQEPNGICQVTGCTTDEDCAPGGDGTCVQIPNPSLPDILTGTCVDSCVADTDCRVDEGYRCANFFGTNFCRHPEVGDPCATADDCGGAPTWDCLTEADGFPGGYCTVSCEINSDCTISSNCDVADMMGDPGLTCSATCTTDEFCRPGYTCQPVQGTDESGCIPAP